MTETDPRDWYFFDDVVECLIMLQHKFAKCFLPHGYDFKARDITHPSSSFCLYIHQWRRQAVLRHGDRFNFGTKAIFSLLFQTSASVKCKRKPASSAMLSAVSTELFSCGDCVRLFLFFVNITQVTQCRQEGNRERSPTADIPPRKLISKTMLI